MPALVPPFIREACARYRIQIELRSDWPASRWETGVCWGPNSAIGVKWSPRSIVTDDPERVGIEDYWHELAHAVLGPASVQDAVPESWALIPYEWVAAKEISRTIGNRREADKFLSSVREYQLNTGLSTGWRQIDVSDWKAPWRSVWWRDGLARAQHAGLLDTTGRVTWKRLSARESFRLHTIPDDWYTGKRTRRV